ncbi:CFI-box-CTERM domain-containing protein [Archangium violaceum]|uniref:CFI-box-CTERM domain-containing protein n=1 Tax=Archangium violaceum TaxID=83451 RepID=UPI001F3FA983|nr:CFI-box-CTERM domain-containing protein [Archangium violaceum]
MQPEELFQAAQKRAATISLPRAQEAQEQLRAQALALFARIPEPPVYHRAEDPARKAAEALLPELEKVLAMALAVAREAGHWEATERILAALKAHGEALCHTVGGRLVQAEEAWRRAIELERQAHPTRALGTKEAVVPAVYDRASGASRYDPRQESVAQVKLICPNTGCKRINDFGFVPGPGTRRYVCPACGTPFLAYFGELRGLEIEHKSSSRRYFFTVDEVRGSGSSRIEFEEASGEEFPVARRDLLVFLYTEARELKVVRNLTNDRLMWISPAGSCFVVTAAFGEGAPELVAFREFRDEVLRRHGVGREFIRVYYRYGPGVAEWVVRRPGVRRGVRGVLKQVHRVLKTTRSAGT